MSLQFNPTAKRPRNDLLLRAMAGEQVPRPPVWMMRQAGRADPEYLAYRERVGHSLYDLFRDPAHAVPITLLPQRFGVDALILYQDILTILEPMGAVFHFTPGPTLEKPFVAPDDLTSLRPFDPAEELAFVGKSIAGVLDAVQGELPLLGFAGSPFTLAAFMLEGGSPGTGIPKTLAAAKDYPTQFAALLDGLTEMTIDYLRYKAACGVHGVQLFESVGHVIPRDVYETYAQPTHQRIAEALRGVVPFMLFVRDSPYVDLMAQSGADVLSLGAGVHLGEVLAQGSFVVQGNVDNRLLLEGTEAQVAQAVRDCVAQTGGRRHILNLSHGLLPNTPFANVLAFVEAARGIAL